MNSARGKNAGERRLKTPLLGDFAGDGANPTYLMGDLHQAGAEGNQPREAHIGESQPFNIEDVFSTTDVVQHIGELVWPQHRLVVGV